MQTAFKKPQVIAVVGAQWGDEGKGKIVDFLASDADVVIRAQGGDNAGHTVSNDQGKFGLHLIPAGIFNPKTINIIGAGVALNPKTLLKELEDLTKAGVSVDNIFINPKAHLVFDYHLFLDRYQEELRGDKKIDTTKRGIGPAYMDKSQRIGIQARWLKKPDQLLLLLKEVLDQKKKSLALSNTPDEFNVEYYEESIKTIAQHLTARIIDTEEIVTDHLNKGSKFVIEGAHGVLLDLDHGTYPKVTSSNPIAAGLLVGAGIPPLKLTKIVGVFKSYQTRVGAGGMPTELLDEQGNLIREKGHEYGTTTGRPRRVGFFDAVAARYAHELNGFTDIAITRLDTLAETCDLKVCSSYLYKGLTLKRFPMDDEELIECKPNYSEKDTFSNWQESELKGVKSYESLPQNLKNYCQKIMESFPDAKLSFLGVGASRDDLIIV